MNIICKEYSQIYSNIRYTLVLAWSLKNKELFRIQLVDRPHVLFRNGPKWSLNNGEVFKIGLKCFG